MNHLLRDLAPLSPEDWALLDEEASTRLRVALAARRLVDLRGPFGWSYSATNLGRVGPTIDAQTESIAARTRRVLPVTEVRADFSLDLLELEANSRGAEDVDLGALDAAALRLAGVENRAVFFGWEAAGITGIAQASPHQALVHDGSPAHYLQQVTQAVSVLKHSGIGGPYALAVGPEDWVAVIEAGDDGYPVLRHLESILSGPIEWTPGIEGAIVLSTRGEDFVLELGEDFSLGYTRHDVTDIHLYLEETLTFRVNTPEAAIAIVAAS
ncbi:MULTISPECIES: family 1 encapsulin nanocompartment shell protein [Microbacterium]|uniref:Type 1 encapsulin shell protein n=2 Tax=Microbacterium TaxID=33882 RepID=A0A1R4KA21_9MICO|nr:MULTISPECIES: family 1 encapsulin nanocompartment shell protein [Microbacterium]GEC77077.1 bacteriocin [Microbacterium liquefaciens]GGV66299.1 bacteriocin [Microbacterium liquefaciens]SJN41156.1 Encapsulating protein for a DyP-type peroxidase or ferritin-like protein oligomers [Microbacterium esteraromaticum]